VEPRVISIDQAMRCAKREPGRSWEALESELNKLGELDCTLLDLPACDSYQPAVLGLSATMRRTQPGNHMLPMSKYASGTQHVMGCNNFVVTRAHRLPVLCSVPEVCTISLHASSITELLHAHSVEAAQLYLHHAENVCTT
jgi:hypothetical protein